ncbi:MAG: alpha/beta fold hydrolase [Terriglobia bacterium]
MKKKIGGVTLAWEDAGPLRPERGQELPVVLLHAFPLNKSMWNLQRDELARRYRVITPDFRGHGDSGVPEEDSTMGRLAEDVRGLLDALGLERVVLGGLSMGGYVAFAFYRRHAARVAALILANTRASADTEEGRPARYQLARVAEQEGSSAVAVRMLPKLLAASTREKQPPVVARVREMILSTSPAGIARALRGMAVRSDSTSLLPTIQCPTLVLAGAEDSLTPPAEAEAMTKSIPGARFEVIPEAGHLSNLEQPARFTRRLDDFLARLRP